MNLITYEGSEERMRFALMEAIRAATTVNQLRVGLRLSHLTKAILLSRGETAYVVDLPHERRIHIVT